MGNVRLHKPDYSKLLFRIIVVVLAILFLFNCLSDYLRARVTRIIIKCETNCKDIGTALEIYQGDNNNQYPQDLKKLTPDYLASIPTCESSGTNRGYIDSYHVGRDFKAYTFYCSGKNHSSVSLEANFPEYSSKDGLVLKP